MGGLDKKKCVLGGRCKKSGVGSGQKFLCVIFLLQQKKWPTKFIKYLAMTEESLQVGQSSRARAKGVSKEILVEHL